MNANDDAGSMARQTQGFAPEHPATRILLQTMALKAKGALSPEGLQTALELVEYLADRRRAN